MSEGFNQISPSEFFYRNRDLAGFSNPTRSLYTAVREFVENSLDACDQHHVLPRVSLSIQAAAGEKDPRTYRLTVSDNGPGMDSEHIPLAFGTVLYGSKFGLKQARGMFGLGATMAILYGQITSNKPVTVSSSTDGRTGHQFEILLDIQKNRPIILKHETSRAQERGLSVSIHLVGDYTKAGSKIRDYVYQTSMITPYADISFQDPKENRYQYGRIIKTMPDPPTVINPHPHGIDVETLRRMTSGAQRRVISSDDIAALADALGVRESSHDAITTRAARRWKRLNGAQRLVSAVAASLGKLPADMAIEEIGSGEIRYYQDGQYLKSPTASLEPFGSFLDKVSAGEPLESFLMNNFQRVGPKTAAKFAQFAGFKPHTPVGTLSNAQLVGLSDSLHNYEQFLSPDPSCLAPLGEKPLEQGIKKFFQPDFMAVVQRNASAYSGFPFVVEMGIAYGGSIQRRGIKAYRFANRIPLLYDEGSDVVLKVINETDWNRYKVKSDAPLVIVSHICSTRIPYKTVGKENVADRPEIEKELRLALQFLARRISSHMSRRGRAEAAKKRANLYSKYLPLIAQFCTALAGKSAEPKYEPMIRIGDD